MMDLTTLEELYKLLEERARDGILFSIIEKRRKERPIKKLLGG